MRPQPNDMVRWCRDLEAEVEHLRRQIKQICGDDEPRLHKFGLTPSEERILRLLLIRDFASHEAISSILYWDKREEASPGTVKVFVSNLRRKLPAIKHWLKCVAGRGYYLTQEGKHWIRAELILARAA
jgi:DNA-binding response OmpR family regulator